MDVAQSSHLQTYEYDPQNMTLRIMFVDGSVYEYAGVPPNIAEGLRQNGGSGTFFHANIRNLFPTTKLDAGTRKKALSDHHNV